MTDKRRPLEGLAGLAAALCAIFLWTAAVPRLQAQVVAEQGARAEATAAAEKPGSTEGAAEARESKPKDVSPVFHLRDQSRIAGKPKLKSLDVETRYGPLSIPLDQLVRVRFARRLPAELQAKIESLIKELGDEDFDKREAATAGLKEIGAPALDAIRKAAKSDNDEVKNRADGIIGGLAAAAKPPPAADDDSMPQLSGTEDEITTTRMTVKGHVNIEEIALETQYGDLHVAVSDLGGITFRTSGPSTAKATVSCQNQPPQNWLETKVELEKGQKLKIEATGQVTVRNYGIVSGPDGNRDYSGHATFNNFPMLSLVGKVGKKGEPFLIGNSYTGKVRGQGKLYLGIVTFSPYPGGSVGSYQVKVHSLGME
jgi:hypothetical protein